MVNIVVMQTDNRPNLDYLLLTQTVNKQACNYLNYNYIFIELNSTKYEGIHPATAKIYIVNEFIQNSKDVDILIFLDSDAWIQNCYSLNKLTNHLINDDSKHGCYSRDPYNKKTNTFINSGSFILKINDYTKNMYNSIIYSLENDESNFEYKNKWPYDQFYISNFIFNNKNDFYIFIPNILNTPNGQILRHYWRKYEKKMYVCLENLIKKPGILMDQIDFNFEKCYDIHRFPN